MPDSPVLWQVTVTVGGEWHPTGDTHTALCRLQVERPFLESLRYDEHRAEVSYWEEGDTMGAVASLALGMWNEHRESADLPAWEVVGLEVLQRDVYELRRTGPGLVLADIGPRPF